MASLSKRITQKGGFRMRGRKLLAVGASLALLVALAVGMTASGAATGPAEATFTFGALTPITPIVAASDTDVGTPLTAFDGVAPAPVECFVDLDGSGGFTPGEPIYRQAAAACVAVVAGNVRLTPFGAFPVGSIVAGGNPDVGNATAAFLLGELYVDLDGSGSFTPGEPIYRDVDGNGAVSAGDLRLSVTTGDGDVTFLLTAFPATDLYVDADGFGTYSLGEVVYRDVDGSVTVSGGDIRLTAFGAFPAGSVVQAGDPDVFAVLVPFAASDGFVDLDSSGNYSVGEPIYRDASAPLGSVSVGDFRLTQGFGGRKTNVNPGDFALLDTLIVTDGAIGPTFVPLLVEQVCVAMTAGSTIRASEILELRLYRENGAAAGFAGFGPTADDLLGRIPNPTLATLGDTCFGTARQLLFSVNGINNTASETLYIVATFAPWAQRGDSLRLTVEMRANDDLAGSGARQSSQFTNSGSVLVIPSPNSTVISGPAAGALFVIDETASLVGSAAPGSTIVLQQFSIENRENVLVTIERITAFAEGFRNGQLNNSVLAGITRVRLFRESGSTGPGWQEGDELLGTVTRPDLVNGARFGGNRRTLITIQPRSVQRFYIVADLSVGMNDGDVIQGAVEVSASSGRMIAPPKITPALGSWEIEAPAATITVGDVTLSSRGKAKVSVANVPLPGLDSIQGVISFDPEIIQVVSTAQGTYRVRGLGNYLVDDLTVDNNGGTIEFLLILKPGRKPLTGSGDIMEIEFESASDVNPGDSSPLDIEIDAAADVNGDELIFDEVSGTARIKLIMGDVDGNGVVTRRDATLLARWRLGRAVLTAIQKKAADVDHSCPATTNWETLAPGGCVNETDERWIKEAAAGLRTLRSSANFQVLGRGLTVLMLPSGGLELHAPSAERLSLQVFALSGQMVFSAESATGTLRFAGVSYKGQRLAKGVYLYVVTLYGRDGSVWRSEVRKLIIR
jgi:hypothetical protein